MIYDMLIIGSGPAGMTSAIYGLRANLKVALFEKSAPGGAMINTAKIENYPGYKSIDGVSLSMNMYQQVIDLGVDYYSREIEKIEKGDDKFKVFSDGEIFYSKTVIIATGTKNKKLSVENEEKFSGRGISWCAICDGNFFKNKIVAVVGGGNSALEEGMYLSGLAKKVYIIHRRDEFRASKRIVEEAMKKENIEFVYNTIVTGFSGSDKLEGLILKKLTSGNETILNVDGCFEYIGQEPNSNFVKGLNITNEKGYIMVDNNFETKIKGLFAAGDIINKEFRQIATAVNDGAIAALSASRYCK